MPSATGSDWEKYKKTFADDEVPEKKITPLTAEYVALVSFFDYICEAHPNPSIYQRHSSAQNIWRRALRRCSQGTREKDQRQATKREREDRRQGITSMVYFDGCISD